MSSPAEAPAVPRRERRLAAGGARDASIEAALTPVAGSLLDLAAASAERARAEADADAAHALSRARADAAQILADARAEGARVAARAGAIQLIGARREAREAVLEARRRAYEALRQRAVEAVVAEAATTAGGWLGERLEELVRSRVGPGASTRRVGAGDLTAIAEAGHRRAVLGPEDLVDEVLASMATEIEGLWA